MAAFDERFKVLEETRVKFETLNAVASMNTGVATDDQEIHDLNSSPLNQTIALASMLTKFHMKFLLRKETEEKLVVEPLM